VNEGAGIINDISAGSMDEEMFQTIAQLGVPYIMMHMKGTPQTMASQNDYEDITTEVCQYFASRIQKLRNLGVNDLIVDPGFGFGKTVEDQYKMIEEVEHLGFGRFPFLIGISRKSFIYKPLNKKPLEIGEETQILHRKVLEKGAKILRVHDVKETKVLIDEFK